MSYNPRMLRNFSIVAHIDHGKSTLADRLLQLTKTIDERQFRDQFLDDMDLERERGITIKSHPVRMRYLAKDGNEYILNLIDTPGHVDFSYEVSRSLSACEGALLVVDAAQGVEAQTVANCHLCANNGLEVIPVINKVDLPNANIAETKRQLEEVLAVPSEDALCVSAKTGVGVEELLEAVVKRIPPPAFSDGEELRALIFDSLFDTFRGVIVYVRIFSGIVEPHMKIMLMSTGKTFEVQEVGYFSPHATPQERLHPGEVGYIIANIKDSADVKIGDTITSAQAPATNPLPGFKHLRPMVFSSFYPITSTEYENLKSSLNRLRLNDPSFTYEPENSVALGFGFRCGFLGLLHMEIIQERLEREYQVGIVASVPSVIYSIKKKNGTLVEIDNPSRMPSLSEIDEIREPMIRAFIIVPNEMISALMKLAQERRGTCTRTESIDKHRVILTFELPLNEVVLDFYDRLKSVTSGYGSMDYEYIGFSPSDIVKLDILLNKEPVDAFSFMVHRSKAEGRGRQLAERLREVIPQQLFRVAIQAAIENRIIASEVVRPLKKDVTAKCYGGDITRKRKLWDKQKAGKRKMKQVGKVNIPHNAFIEVLKLD
ncbi:MAG: translation elongation factor 4 [Candidatus Aureabacteria bacterium]|nr:translation elongation factor 4 [Candidatus Auribacterota bacterium]